MRRLHIIEGDDMGYRHNKEKYMYDPELREAYECGVKEGWRQAMEEQYGERNRNYGSGYGERHMPYEHRGNIMYRDVPPMYREDDMYEERRRRDSRGRYM